ncbi:MAG: ParB/RepB/Spo0J family partition protein [Geminicoccaceae bacterium]
MSSTPGGRRRGLGMGLSALLGEAPDFLAGGDPGAVPGRASRIVPVELLHPSALQPRRRFAEAELEALAASIRDKGLLQPLLVRPLPDPAAGFEIVAGERRWRAAQRAGLHEVPVVVRALADAETLELALIENLQRADLTPFEEGEAFRRLIDEFGHRQEDLARALGRSRSHVANTMRLLALPPAIRGMVEDGTLSAGHARALLGARDAERLAIQVMAKGLNVRQTEALVRREARTPRGVRPDPDIAALERDLSQRLGLRVAIRRSGHGGTLTLRFSRASQLEDILRRLA